MADFSFDVSFNIPNVEGKLSAAIKFGQFILDQQVVKDSNYYVPVDQHFLEKSALAMTKFGEGKVIWQTPYARRLYYNPQYNFSKDVNPNAQGLWFEAAKAKKKSSWAEMAKNAVKSKL